MLQRTVNHNNDHFCCRCITGSSKNPPYFCSKFIRGFLTLCRWAEPLKVKEICHIMEIIVTIFELLFSNFYIRFEDLVAVNIKTTVFWDVMPCSLAESCYHCRGICVFFYRTEDRDNRFSDTLAPIYQTTQCHIQMTVNLFCSFHF